MKPWTKLANYLLCTLRSQSCTTINNQPVFPRPSVSQLQSNGFHSCVSIAPELLSTRKPTLESACCQSWGQSLSPLPTNGGNGQPICIPQSCPLRHGFNPVSAKCSRRHWMGGIGGALFSHHQSRTVGPKPGQGLEMHRFNSEALGNWCCCYWRGS